MRTSNGPAKKRTIAAHFFRDLAMDLVESAVADLGVVAQRDDALQWINGGDAPVGFAECCDALNVDALAMRRHILATPKMTGREALEAVLSSLRQPSDTGAASPAVTEVSPGKAFSRPK